jgi:EmrB/QacA subfamily drug resistance transporter
MSIIRNVFTDARERAQAIGMWGATVGISLALGPVVGGALVDGVGWRSVFWINVPIGALAFVLTRRFVPESRAPRPRRVDAVGQVLVIVMLASLTYAIIAAPKAGWVSDQTLGLFALSAACLCVFVPYERRRVEPLLEPRFFASIPFSGASAIAVLAFAALGAFLLLNTFYLQEVRGYSPLHAGLLMLPLALATIVFSPLSGRIVGRRGPRIGLLLGGLGIALAGALMSRISGSTPVVTLLAAYLVFGVGFGMVNPPITNTAVLGMPAAQAGVAAAVASTSRQVGQTLGVAVSGAIAVGAAGIVGPDFILNSRAGWLIVAGCGMGVLALGLASTTARARASAERVAGELRGAAPGRAETQPARA